MKNSISVDLQLGESTNPKNERDFRNDHNHFRGPTFKKVYIARPHTNSHLCYHADFKGVNKKTLFRSLILR